MDENFPDDELTRGWAPLREERRQLSHLLAHYAEALKASQKLNPKATGVTREGLDAFYIANTHSFVSSDWGQFNAQLVAREPRTDLAFLKVSGLTKAQERSFPPALRVTDQPVNAGDQVTSYGYIDGKLEAIPAKVVKNELESNPNGVASVFETDAYLTPGTSG